MSVTWTARLQIFLTFSKLLAIIIIIVPGMYQLFKGKPPSVIFPNICQYYCRDLNTPKSVWDIYCFSAKEQCETSQCAQRQQLT